jgi:hypothetical protein
MEHTGQPTQQTHPINQQTNQNPNQPNQTNQTTPKDAYVKQAPPPSAECCQVAKAFNDARCSCDPAVLALAVQFAGGSPGFYQSMAKGFATACNFPVFIGPTCGR